MNHRAHMLTTALAVLAGLGACAPMDGSPDRADPALAGPPVRVLGEAQSCVRIAQIRNTRVRSDQVIDFELTGGKVYRNVLNSRCPRLGFERAFTYNTSLNRLCKPEIIYTLEQRAGSIERGAGCGLGEFVPVEYLASDE